MTGRLRPGVERGSRCALATCRPHQHPHTQTTCIRADTDARSANDTTPLHAAAMAGDLDMCRLLVERGEADPAPASNTWRTDSVFGHSSGQTPLHWVRARCRDVSAGVAMMMMRVSVAANQAQHRVYFFSSFALSHEATHASCHHPAFRTTTATSSHSNPGGRAGPRPRCGRRWHGAIRQIATSHKLISDAMTAANTQSPPPP